MNRTISMQNGWYYIWAEEYLGIFVEGETILGQLDFYLFFLTFFVFKFLLSVYLIYIQLFH